MNEKPAAAPDKQQASALDLLEIWNIFWSYKYMIIALALVASIFAFIKVQYFTPDVYSTSGTLYVLNRDEYQRALDNDTAVYGSDISTSQQMTGLYVEILNTRAFYENVSAAVGGRYSPGQIRGMLSITNRNETPLLDVTVTCNSAADAAVVANAILAEAPKKLYEVFDSGEVKVVEWAVEPSAPRDKGASRRIGISFLAGLAVGCAIAFLLNFLDNKIHRSEDVAKRYGISILGEISQ